MRERTSTPTPLRTCGANGDIANRLIEVDGVEFTWDANGNLLSDGVSTYTYNHTNRLNGLTQGDDTYAFAYNGLGDRLRQTINSEATNYTLDLVAGLTQVLEDSTNAYLYGVGRIGEEQPNSWQYHLVDVLSSVRQLTDMSCVVMLTQSYKPFGTVLSSEGSASTAFQFTGEQRDETGLIYLRARYYAPANGRFLSRDIWDGDSYQPISYNAWLYARGNPIRFRDPSGLITESETSRAEEIVDDLLSVYGVKITKDWGWNYVPTSHPYVYPNLNTCSKYWLEGNWRTVGELEWVREAIEDIAPGKMSISSFRSTFRLIEISRTSVEVLFGNELRAFAPPGILADILGDVVLANYAFDHGSALARFTVAHELGHVWDYRTGDQLSMGLMLALDTWICDDSGQNCYWAPYAARVDETTLEIVYPEKYPGTPKMCGDEPPNSSHKVAGCEKPPYAATYGGFPLLTGPGAEDWADSFASYVYPDFYPSRDRSCLKRGGIRENYVRKQINSLP
jgi:RHS repeat-associated protein